MPNIDDLTLNIRHDNLEQSWEAILAILTTGLSGGCGGSTRGADGRPGTNARALALVSDRLIFTYDDASNALPNTQAATLTYYATNLTTAVTWSAFNNLGDAIVLDAVMGDATKRTLSLASFGSSNFVTVRVSAENGTIVDLATIVRVSNGSAGNTGKILRLSSDRNSFTYTYEGVASPLTGQAASISGYGFNLVGYLTWSAIDDQGSAITLSDGSNANNKILTLENFGASQWVRVTATAESGTITESFTVVRLAFGQSITGPQGPAGAAGPIGPIGPAGPDGAIGPAGADGASVKVLNLTSNLQSFKFDSSNTAAPSLQTATFTQQGQNLTTTPVWTAVNNLGDTIALTTTSNQNERQMSIAAFGSSLNATITVSAENGTIFDTLLVWRLLDGGVGPMGTTGATGPAGPTGPSIYRIAPWVTTAPLTNEILWDDVADVAYRIASNFSGCIGKVGTPPAASFVISARKNDVEYGTITVATSGAVTFSTGGVAVDFAI